MKKICILFAALFCLFGVIGCGDFNEEHIYKYTVKFESNGGSSVEPITELSVNKITLPSPSRTGHTFAGWYSSAEGGSKYGSGGSSWTPTGNVTMYARWNAINYTITFDSQEGSSVEPITAAYASQVTLPEPTKEGYPFIGWYSEDFGTKYNSPYTITGNVTMYARWTFTLAFDSRGGSSVPSFTGASGSSVPLPPAPTREGYTFDGWYSAATGGTKYWDGGDSYTLAGDITMYARWLATLTFNSQGGESVSPITQLSGSSVPLPTTSLEGYTFNGWYNSAEGGTKYNSPYTLAGSVTMYARWTVNNYTLTFNSQGGSSVPSKTAAYGTQITLPTPTRSGYTFGGWYSAAEGGEKYESPYIVSGNVTMYARWIINYTLTFNVQGGSSVPSITDTAGSSVELPTPTRSGYTFVGWYNSSSGGTKYGDGGDSYTLAGNATMYARWDGTITFDTQGGESVSSQTAAVGTSITLPPATKSGYTFGGWYSLAVGGTKYDSPYTISGDVTMYARWIATLTFDSQSGSSVSPIIADCGSSVILPVSMLANYNFDGWYSSASGGTKYDSPYTISGDVTMYAQWTIIDLGTNGSGNDGDEMTVGGIALVLVKAGTFTMGSPTSEANRYNDETQHQVTLTNDYWISKYPVTQAQYSSVMGSNPSYYSGSNNPVEYVTWYNANDFCQAVGGRLPTEAEWEFAARGGNKSQGYIYSGSNNLGTVGWYYDNNSSYGTKPVGQKLPNELGIYDMSGNVYEWCNDWYGTYPTGAVTNPTGPSSGSYRVVRGGYWRNEARYCRVAYRYEYDNLFDSYSGLGFRIVFPRE